MTDWTESITNPWRFTCRLD